MLKKARLTLVLALVLAVAMLATACGGNDEPATGAGDDEEERMKVGFIYVSPTGDYGWTYAHEKARQYIEAQLDWVDAIYIEDVAEGPASEAEMQRLVNEGAKIIFTTSFGYMDSTIAVAERNPDVVFMHCSGDKTADNAGNYFGRIYQPRYLSGIAAGLQTETNTIGYVAAFPIPEVVRGINAFTLGVRSVNPDAVVKVIWTNTWYDPVKEKNAAKVLLDDGADIIAMHQDTPGPMQAAAEAGKYGVGYNSDMSVMVPDTVLTSPVWNWGPYYVEVIKSVKEGTWKPEAYWGGLESGVVDLAPFGPMVSDEVKELVEEKKELILSGEWDVFHGPIYDQDGNERVAEGEKLTDEEMLSIDWFVEGVIGTIN
ncbi:BMP family ABC transporter substrate-binding protein [Desulfofalx alkaliphila]|uniref:BMP family ABC transporter substrate-binding protein n=1 Tax=Desulfofalx alkaliphila TaxID=105483 RepID=UPI0004E1E08A|nr:BMP family ABC transporter substrate-binding protein [Desulfofalx alkaliphila]